MRTYFFAVIFLCCSAGSVHAADTDAFIYDSHGKRDPFVSLVGVQEKAAAPADVTGLGDLSFQGVATDSKGDLITIINGDVYKKGDRIGEIVVKEIRKDSVVVTVDGKDNVLKLYE